MNKTLFSLLRFSVVFTVLFFADSAVAQETDTAGCCVLAGDTTNDGEVTIFDASYLLDFVFADYPAPDCLEQADFDGSGSVNVSDILYLVIYIFQDGPAPVCPPPPL
ncbi:MAG: hypothetical protein IIB00_04410 [candidate division Zixibacteria bacterium]|nr:hypothetical protein [candidate division Zixibacteria bacterium]